MTFPDNERRRPEPDHEESISYSTLRQEQGDPSPPAPPPADYAAAYNFYNSQPSTTNVTGHQQASAPPPVTRKQGPLARPLPLWLYLGGLALILVLMVIFYFRGSDWADQAGLAGTVALIVGIILVLVTYVRSQIRGRVIAHPARRVFSALFIIALFG